MACKKCGSGWVTATGRDCSRCPHCDKLQLCLARKAGRWTEPVVVKQCACCGRDFEAVGPKQISQRVLCGDPDCDKTHRKAGKERRAAGVFLMQQSHGTTKPCRHCKRCGKGPLARHQKDYCSRECAGADAREYKRDFMGVPAVIRKSLHLASWFVSWDTEREAACRPAPAARLCVVCDKPTQSHEHRFCSRECMYAWRGDRPCDKCGGVVHKAQSHGSVVCKSCKKKFRNKNRSHFRKRARHHGVLYVPVSRLFIYERDKWICQICHRRCKGKWLINKVTGKPHPLSPTIDHIIPMACGGDHVPENLQLACFACNTKKGATRHGQLRLAIR